MRELLLGLVGGVILVVTAWVSRSCSRDESPSQRALDRATSSPEEEVEVVEEILEGDSPEEDLSALINEKLND